MPPDIAVVPRLGHIAGDGGVLFGVTKDKTVFCRVREQPFAGGGFVQLAVDLKINR